MATPTFGVISTMTSEVSDVIERFTDRNNLCILNDGSPTYLKPQAQHSQNPTSAIDLSICTPGLAFNVHGRSFLTHMVVITIRSWYPCLLLLETRTRVVIPVTGCSQRLTGSNLQSCAWTRSLLISSMTKTPHLICRACRCCNRQHPKSNHSPKKVQPLVWWRMPGNAEDYAGLGHKSPQRKGA